MNKDMKYCIENDLPLVTYWTGKNISDMDREELEKAFEELGMMYQELLEKYHNHKAEQFTFPPPEELDWLR